MDKWIVGILLVLAACNGSGSGTSSGTSASTSSTASTPSGGTTTSSGPPATPSSTSPGATPADTGSGSSGGGVTINNTNVNTNVSGSSASSGASSSSGSNAGAQAGAASSASASASSSAPPAQLSFVTAAEGPVLDVDLVTLEVVAIELFWTGYDDRLVRDGMSCRMPGATFTLVTATGALQENPNLFAFADAKTITYDFTKTDTMTIEACSTDHLGTPEMVWVVGRVKVHHAGAQQWRDAHGQLTCMTDDGQQLVVLRMTPPVKLRNGKMSIAGFHLRSADITEQTVSCAASTTQPPPPECAKPIEAFEPTGSRLSYWISSGFASTATDQS